MIGIDLKPELDEMVSLIGQKNVYRGHKVSDSIMRMFEVEITDLHDGVLVPYWIGILEHGRGPWLGRIFGNPLLRVRIYNWMKKHNMFRSKTESGKRGEAFVIARYINKHGNEQFRKGIYMDVYNTVRKETITKIDKKFGFAINKITMEVI
jgi:hypothetical protein